jgi:hypothetical protein
MSAGLRLREALRFVGQRSGVTRRGALASAR